MAKIICAWCKAELGTNADVAGEASHGMCEKCSHQFLSQLDEVANAHP